MKHYYTRNSDQSRVKISIVTPSYNQAEFLETTISSVLSQGYPNLEYIIIDGGSTDGSVEIIKKYEKYVTYWISEKDQGQSDALNKGFRAATGEIVGWLNADDLYLSGCFNAIAEFFGTHPECDVVYGDYRWINEGGAVLQNRREIGFDLFVLKYLHILYIPTTATFFHRRVFDDRNFLDTAYRYAMDYDFFLRLALKGYRFYHLKEMLADFRWHTMNKSLAVRDASFEQGRSLLAHDPLLRSIPRWLVNPVRVFFMGLARLKRCVVKGLRGYYFFQWRKT
jgi:glycosyltransferase involved in cell wall biosynthesis